MKQKTLKLAIFAAMSAVAIPASADVTLYDYTEATSAFEDAYLSASANIARTRKDSQASYNVNLNGNYNKVISTPKRDTTFKLKADGRVSRSGVKDAKSEDAYTINGSSTIDTYFREGSKGAFWFGKIGVGASSESDDLDTTLGVGLGYGRVVNVTPMAKAIRLIEALNYRGSIHGKPSKAVHNQIANIIAREAEYASKHGRKDYQKYWIADIESVLRGAGVLGGNLNAAGVLQARDVLVDERISTRKLGWKVRAGLNYVGSNFSGIKNKPGLELGAEYHRPLSNRTQFSNEAVLTTVFDNSASDAYKFINNMTLTHEVDARIDWENAWTLQYDKIDGGSDVTTNTLSSTFLYELTNSLDYSIEAKVTNTDGTKDDGTDRSLNMGIRYRLK